ncbi:unnamed protein product [Miscanthus lutarioriparius]|uniref:Telomere-associated protein Rif1 N-terminal domain-containing protein n=1 Tax=Miscanthus lutarioriparius TaxID=422564 RepID=A0A811SD01_9POAL|nr:unnamed protein product [Miscanthus lutarioriparius]
MEPPPVEPQVAEIAAEPDRAAAYARLLHLQRGCAADPSAAADLAAELPSTLLPLLLLDAAANDEAVAVSALKCLGFTLYHPVLVSTISAQMAQLALDTLVQIIMNTRMKSACNLGVWCFSVQQLEPLIIEDRADPMLIAIVHALDNPFGSLSTTFEAAQAIMKLADQSPKRMRDQSCLWVPPVYRRLLSADKTERDMAERCLINVSCIILPPQPLLSKAVASDLEQKLLSCMVNMLDDPSEKVQTVKSWGWIISLLGPDAVNNRPLLNKLLKVPEQMFTDLNPQVQVATMVSWKKLVDAFFPSQATEIVVQQTVIPPLKPIEQASAELFQDMIPETLVIVMDSATEIFRFLLQGIQIELREQHAYEQVSECITNVCMFAKKLLLDHIRKNSVNKCATLLEFGLRFVKVIVDELDHSLLASENIEVCLDIEHIKENQQAEYSPKVSLPRIRSLPYMEMVSPAVYVAALSLSMISQYTGELSRRDAEKLVLILASSDVLESFRIAVSFMYMQIGRPTCNRERLKWLMVWNSFAKQLNSQIISYLETNSGLSYHDVLHQFFCYPILYFLYPKGISILLNAENSSESNVSVLQDLEMESTIEVYRSLSTNSCNSKFSSKVFFDGFYKYLVCTIDENMALFQANLEHLSEKFENATILSALGEIVIGLLQNDQMLTSANQEVKETSEDSFVCKQPKLFLNWFKLANRFMRLSSFHFKANPAGQHQVTIRFFSTLSNLSGHLILKEDVLLLFEIIGDQLTEWLSLTTILYSEMQQGEIIVHLENLWLKMVECLKRSQLVSDVPLINQKQRLLQAALNHPHHPISVATASICRPATHGNAILHPGCLISEFDELLMHRRKALNSSRKTAITSNSTDLMAERDGGSVNVSVGLGRKRLKIMKYSTKPKELNKSRAHMGFSPRNMENTVCRKPELILEMLQRKT